jgi:hypothetical protein
MYQPGGAMFGFLVTLSRYLPPPRDFTGRSTDRWFGSEEWVTATGRIRDARVIFPLVSMTGLEP